MRITIESTSPSEFQRIVTLLKSIRIDYVAVENKHDENISSGPKVTSGDPTVEVNDLFGIWKEKPRDLAAIRKESW